MSPGLGIPQENEATCRKRQLDFLSEFDYFRVDGETPTSIREDFSAGRHLAQCGDYRIVSLGFNLFIFCKIKQRRVEKTIDALVKRRDSTFPPTNKKTLWCAALFI